MENFRYSKFKYPDGVSFYGEGTSPAERCTFCKKNPGYSLEESLRKPYNNFLPIFKNKYICEKYLEKLWGLDKLRTLSHEKYKITDYRDIVPYLFYHYGADVFLCMPGF